MRNGSCRVVSGGAPCSRSSGLGLGLLAWLIVGKVLRKPVLGSAVCIGIVSHLILDLITHAPDIAIAPGINQPKFGLGLYRSAPLLAFFLEIAYGVFCWRIYRGGKALLAVIVLFNLANLPLLSSAVPGPKELLAGRPLLIVTVIAVQIILTLTLVGVFSREERVR
jgi:hypothetical protein